MLVLVLCVGVGVGADVGVGVSVFRVVVHIGIFNAPPPAPDHEPQVGL